MPDRAITGFPDCRLGEFLVLRLELLRQTTSGLASASQRISTGSRPLTPFTLKVTIFIQEQTRLQAAREAPDESSVCQHEVGQPAGL
jgi:hypothetical protein